jgi:hypothetical protein
MSTTGTHTGARADRLATTTTTAATTSTASTARAARCRYRLRPDGVRSSKYAAPGADDQRPEHEER